jgi:nucleoside-diphosphate-sugar epimerase
MGGVGGPAARLKTRRSWRLENERRVLAAARPGLTTAVVRLGYVYGGAGGTVWKLFAPGADGAVPVPERSENRWAFVHVEDAALLYRRLRLLCDQADAIGASLGRPASRRAWSPRCAPAPAARIAFAR